jgi:two-component system, OmpR family, manganese sensing sensor histidine kinase
LFTNLLTNAIQYTPPQVDAPGERAFRQRQSQINVQLQQLIRQNTAYLQVKIQDISSGSGLGLAIVQSIVNSHQGELVIDSQVDRGTTVIVTFKSNT